MVTDQKNDRCFCSSTAHGRAKSSRRCQVCRCRACLRLEEWSDGTSTSSGPYSLRLCVCVAAYDKRGGGRHCIALEGGTSSANIHTSSSTCIVYVSVLSPHFPQLINRCHINGRVVRVRGCRGINQMQRRHLAPSAVLVVKVRCVRILGSFRQG